MATLHRLYCDRLPVGEAHALTVAAARIAPLP
jgi:hypothetical protein